MKYIVSLGIQKFEFSDGGTATGFAELAMNNFVPTEYNKELKPLISIEKEKKKDSGIACIDCKHYDGSGYCVKNETTVSVRDTCNVAERW